ncbi:hypothetical protein L6452_01656 [Arctium lappa]|uniref:Uncharacterized protein n=1 Tax=Arctium lappa TaxID=4217 RepID=A0ACB9FHB0_ARCLA|nr:hypothetical protein L6452_01656 [Arctium lappa]
MSPRIHLPHPYLDSPNTRSTRFGEGREAKVSVVLYRRRVVCGFRLENHGSCGLIKEEWTDEREGSGYMMFFFFQIEEEWTDEREGRLLKSESSIKLQNK